MKYGILSGQLKLFAAACLIWLCGGNLTGESPEVPSWLQIKPEVKQELGLKYEPVEVKIPGLKKEYKFIWLSDLHVMAEDVSEIEDNWKPAMIHRRDKRFNNPQSNLPPAAVWKKLPAVLNGSNADAVFFGGDICDTGSVANLTLLKSGFSQLTLPFIYLKEDHDLSPWHLISRDSARQLAIAKEIDGDPAVLCLEFDELVVLGIRYSVRHFSKNVVKRFKELYQKAQKEKKSIILILHVPISPKDHPQLSKGHSWGGKMKPTQPTTAEFMKLVKAENGPVKAVFSGHVHYSAEGMITPTLYLHVFDPAFQGTLGIISIKPAGKPE